MKKILLAALMAVSFTCFAQNPTINKSDTWKSVYRATPAIVNDLIHTKLDVSFDFSRSWMYGKAWITLKPHFYPTDTLTLDAKYMNIKEVAVVRDGKNIPLKFSYDSLNLRINLDKTYKGGENYTIYIDYISMPDKVKTKGSAAISDCKRALFHKP